MPRFDNSDDWYIKMSEYIIKSFWDITKYKIKNKKWITSIFLAWAPWAWKTEFLDTIFNDLKDSFIIIDIDTYRSLFRWYNWGNASDYQNASVKIADKILKFCFKNNLNFVFDWTFRNYNKIKENFWQCRKYNRRSLITLIYQEPRISYYYTFLRKLKKRRNVPIDVFVDWFYDSIFNVFKALKQFDNTYLIVAHKKYHPLNKGHSVFKMDNKTKNIKDFCDKYWILYKRGLFLNREMLKFDIKKYNDILLEQLLWRWTEFWKVRIWFIEKWAKLF